MSKADSRLTTGVSEAEPRQQIARLDHPPPGWFVLDVMRKDMAERTRDWVALMVDVDPDDLKTCQCDFPARFYVHPKDYRPRDRIALHRWVRISGKHRNRGAAWDALQNM